MNVQPVDSWQGDLAEAGSIERWQTFLRSYSHGDFPINRYPPLPALSPRQQTLQISLDPEFLYPSTDIDTATARNVRDYISAHEYMPPPRAADEILREQCIQEYELMGDIQRQNVQQAIDILAAYFPDTVCTFTLFNGPKQSFIAVSGDQGIMDEFGLVNDFEVRSDLGFCGHCVLVKEGIMFVPSLPDDWRFARNPYTEAGIESYIGMPVTLPVDSSFSVKSAFTDEAPKQTVGIGALNVLFVKKPLETMSETQSMVVRNVARMLQTQLRATWHGNKRTMEARYRRAVAEMIEDGFVGDQAGGTAHEGVVSSSTMSLEALAQSATERLMVLVPQLGSVGIYDTRNAMHAIAKDLIVDPAANDLRILGHSGLAVSTPPAKALADLVSRRSSRCVFDSANPSGLEDRLSSTAQAHIVMPFSTHDRPAFIILATSDRTSSFTASSVNTIRSIGALLLARATRDAVVEADTAKTIFLSSISHELRTPLYSIMAALRLADGHVEDGQLKSIVPLLDAMRSSSVALQGTLEDVLEFGMPITQKGVPGVEVPTSSSKVDVDAVVRDVVRICLMQQSVSSDRQITYEQEVRDWAAEMDEAKLRRIITNGLSNALTFCPRDPITLSLTTDPSTAQLIISITDQGPGIDKDAIPRLLEPFTKQDIHTPGIGLGLHITKTVVRALGGTLELSCPSHRGTTFRVALPADIRASDDAQSEIEVRREVVTLLDGPPLDQMSHSKEPEEAQVAGEELNAASRQADVGSCRDSDSTASTDSGPATPRISTVPFKETIDQAILDLTIDDKANVQTGRSTPRHRTIKPRSSRVAHASDTSPTPISERVSPPMRVMVIDDNAVCRRLLAALVSRMIAQRRANMILTNVQHPSPLCASDPVPAKSQAQTPNAAGSKARSAGQEPIVRQYADGQSAVDAFLDVRPHLVLTDVSMPGMDGVTAAQLMRALSYQATSPNGPRGGDTEQDTGGGDADEDGDDWTPRRCRIYAITALGSSDPRLKASGLLGSAALDGWFVKGKDDMRGVERVINEMADKLDRLDRMNGFGGKDAASTGSNTSASKASEVDVSVPKQNVLASEMSHRVRF